MELIIFVFELILVYFSCNLRKDLLLVNELKFKFRSEEGEDC